MSKQETGLLIIPMLHVVINVTCLEEMMLIILCSRQLYEIHVWYVVVSECTFEYGKDTMNKPSQYIFFSQYDSCNIQCYTMLIKWYLKSCVCGVICMLFSFDVNLK